MVTGKAAVRVAAAAFYRVISRDRFGFTAFYWDGTCLSLSQKHQAYKSNRYTYHSITLTEKELAKLKEFLIYGDLSDVQRLPH